MSIDRDDCEHGHGRLVVELAAVIAADHGLSMKGAVLVILPSPESDRAPGDNQARVFGQFNTVALAVAADAILELGGEHAPDGCKTCDSAARAMRASRAFFLDRYRALIEGEQPRASRAFSEYIADPMLEPVFKALRLTNSDATAHRLARDAFMRGASWAVAESRARRGERGFDDQAL